MAVKGAMRVPGPGICHCSDMQTMELKEALKPSMETVLYLEIFLAKFRDKF